MDEPGRYEGRLPRTFPWDGGAAGTEQGRGKAAGRRPREREIRPHRTAGDRQAEEHRHELVPEAVRRHRADPAPARDSATGAWAAPPDVRRPPARPRHA